jgi:CubicO group peptidase (beta-lactamase class C family)
MVTAMRKLSNVLLALLVITLASLRTPAIAQEWSLSSPEEQGMSSDRLARLVEFGTFNDMDSLLVTRHGRIVLEATYFPFRDGFKHRAYSVTKSVVSTLFALALRDGRLDSIDRRVVDFFPERTIAHLDERKKAMTVRHLLDMTSGLEWNEGLGTTFVSYIAMERSADWQQYILDRPMATAPGAVFYYNSGNSHLLSAILTKVTGKSALDYARETLFGPLGITDVVWHADPQGISGGGAGLFLQPRDFAKIGMLYLRGGLWEGKQLLPAAWIEEVRRANIDMRDSWASAFRYGRQFWVMPGRDAFMGVGYRRQLMIVMPKRDIVAVVTSSARFPPAGGAPSSPRYRLETLVGYLETAVAGDGPLPANAAGSGELAQRVKEAAMERPGPASESPAMAKAVSGKTWRFDPNDVRIKSVTFKFDGAGASYEYELAGEAAGRFGGPIGLDGRYRSGGRTPSGEGVARGIWQPDGARFVLEVETLGNDDAVRATHRFTDKTVEVDIEWAGGYATTLRGRTGD